MGLFDIVKTMSRSKNVLIANISEPKIAHYSSDELGEFDYDERMFSIHGGLLMYNQDCGLVPVIPKGLKRISGMFSYIRLYPDFIFGENFDLSEIEEASDVFYGAKISDGLNLTVNFNMPKCKKVEGMFRGCHIEDKATITIGEGFNLPNCTEADDIFAGCYPKENIYFCDIEKLGSSAVIEQAKKFIESRST